MDWVPASCSGSPIACVEVVHRLLEAMAVGKCCRPCPASPSGTVDAVAAAAAVAFAIDYLECRQYSNSMETAGYSLSMVNLEHCVVVAVTSPEAADSHRAAALCLCSGRPLAAANC